MAKISKINLNFSWFNQAVRANAFKNEFVDELLNWVLVALYATEKFYIVFRFKKPQTLLIHILFGVTNYTNLDIKTPFVFL